MKFTQKRGKRAKRAKRGKKGAGFFRKLMNISILRNIKKLFKISKQHYPSQIDSPYSTATFDLSRDPISGTYGLDIFTPKAMVLWVVPGQPAHLAGISPRDILVSVNHIKISPGDPSFVHFINTHDFITITVIKTPLIFKNPKLNWVWITQISKHGNNKTIIKHRVQTLSPYEKGIIIESPSFLKGKEQILIQNKVYI